MAELIRDVTSTYYFIRTSWPQITYGHRCSSIIFFTLGLLIICSEKILVIVKNISCIYNISKFFLQFTSLQYTQKEKYGISRNKRHHQKNLDVNHTKTSYL